MKMLITILITGTLLTSCNNYMYPEINHPPQYQNIDNVMKNEPERVIYSNKIVKI